jgi:hypothetical protein
MPRADRSPFYKGDRDRPQSVARSEPRLDWLLQLPLRK